MPLERRKLGKNFRNWRGAAKDHAPDKIHVKTGHVGIVGTDVHVHKGRGLVGNMDISVTEECLARHGPEHKRR